MTDLILYTTDDGKSQIQLRADLGTVWLTQLEMAELFDATKQNISPHLKNLLADGELDANSVVKESLTTASDTKRYRTQLYNLDAILAVGYRVRSPRGVQFRRWASTVLKEYLVKGFVMDDERLKNPDGRPDYFDEMLARIRDIRASEKRFYQKVRDLFALAADYDKTDETTQTFFATVQNLLLYAVTQKTAAELIVSRANPVDSHFGLRSWKGTLVRKQDIVVAKNYLTEDEVDTLNRLVAIFLETQSCAPSGRPSPAWVSGAKTWGRSSCPTVFRCSAGQARLATPAWRKSWSRCIWTLTNAAKRKMPALRMRKTKPN